MVDLNADMGPEEMAKFKENAEFIQRECEKYKQQVESNIGDHEALFGWGHSLLESWFLGPERERIDSALDKVERAIALEDKPLYHSGRARILLWQSIADFNEGQEGFDRFGSSLDASRQGIANLFMNELQNYFLLLHDPLNAPLILQLGGIIHKKGYEDYMNQALPFLLAAQYWVEDRNEAIFTDMPGDLLHAVKALIAEGDRNSEEG